MEEAPADWYQWNHWFFDNNYFVHYMIDRGYHAYRNDDLLDFLF